jgi:putative ABC transport system permease protein
MSRPIPNSGSMRDSAGTFLQDARVGLRVLRASPLVSVAAILSLALGIGATTAFVSLLNALLLRDLPVPSPATLAVVSTAADNARGQTPGWSIATWREFEQRQSLFAGAAAFGGMRFTTSDTGDVDATDGIYVSGDFFATVGVQPALGRAISRQDDAPGGGAEGLVAVVSYDYWQRLGGGRDIIGRTLTLDRVPFTVVGVIPRGFNGVELGRAFDVVVPLAAEPAIRGQGSLVSSPLDRWLIVLLRLKPGQSLADATATLRSVQPDIRQASLPPPQFERRRQDHLKDPFTVISARQGTSGLRLRERFKQPLFVMLGVVAVVLLITCANIANLQMARTAERQHELSMRVALGASQRRLIRQLLLESAMLALAGGVLGALLGISASRLVVAQLATPATPLTLDVSFDRSLLAFVMVLTALVTLLFGLVPAVRASRIAPMDALRLRQAGPTRARKGVLSGGLVAAQIAFSVVLVVCAGLFVTTLIRLNSIELGFDADRVLVMDVNATRADVPAPERAAFYERLVAAAAGAPGVSAAAAALGPPVDAGAFFPLSVDAVGSGEVPSSGRTVVGTFITPDWFRSYGIPIRAGRSFEAGDVLGAPLVAVVNEAFVRTVFTRRQALGDTVDTAGGGGDLKLGRRTIVGVVGDSTSGNLREPVLPTIYFPLSQWTVPIPVPARISVSVHQSTTTPAQAFRTIAAAITRENANVSVELRQIDQEVRASRAQERLIAMISGLFGIVALMLAAVGLYGVTAHDVSRRKPEIGVRLALGAAPASVVVLVLRRLSLLVVVGLAVGIAASLGVSKMIGALLFGVQPRDAMTFGLAAVAVATTAVIAAGIPAMRSGGIDPADVLRES